MTGKLTIRGKTPIKKKPYSATLMFDELVRFTSVHIVSDQGAGTYTVADLTGILDAIRKQKAASALWDDAGDIISLEAFLRENKLPIMCGCIADLLIRMGFAVVTTKRPIKIAAI